jgi:hypothetical protein
LPELGQIVFQELALQVSQAKSILRKNKDISPHSLVGVLRVGVHRFRLNIHPAPSPIAKAIPKLSTGFLSIHFPTSF